MRGEADGEICHLELAATLTAPREARRGAREALRKWQVPPEAVETVELLVSELVTNSVNAGYPAREIAAFFDCDNAECLTLTLQLFTGQLVIEVSDASLNPPVLAGAGADAESGRGLMLVDAYSTNWGYRYSPSGGKVVYAVIDMPAGSIE